MVYKWKRMKGILKSTNQCPVCHGEFPDDDYDLEEDMCLLCLFPEASDSRPADINDLGINETNERKILDNLDYIPEKQSESAQKAYKSYRNRTYLSRK